jgi:hypothetical protein
VPALDDARHRLQRAKQRLLRSFQNDHVFLLVLVFERSRCSRRTGRLWRTLFSPVFARTWHTANPVGCNTARRARKLNNSGAAPCAVDDAAVVVMLSPGL